MDSAKRFLTPKNDKRVSVQYFWPSLVGHAPSCPLARLEQPILCLNPYLQYQKIYSTHPTPYLQYHKIFHTNPQILCLHGAISQNILYTASETETLISRIETSDKTEIVRQRSLKGA